MRALEQLLAEQDCRNLVYRAAAYAQRPADRVTRHLVAQTLMAFPAPGVAQGLSLVQLWIGSNVTPGPHGCAAHVQRVGEFEDHFVLMPRGWRIARREARFVLHNDAIAAQN